MIFCFAPPFLRLYFGPAQHPAMDDMGAKKYAFIIKIYFLE